MKGGRDDAEVGEGGMKGREGKGRERKGREENGREGKERNRGEESV